MTELTVAVRAVRISTRVIGPRMKDITWRGHSSAGAKLTRALRTTNQRGANRYRV